MKKLVLLLLGVLLLCFYFYFHLQPGVEVGQSVATVVAIESEPIRRDSLPELIEGREAKGRYLVVYEYRTSGPAAGPYWQVHFKNGKVVRVWYPN